MLGYHKNFEAAKAKNRDYERPSSLVIPYVSDATFNGADVTASMPLCFHGQNSKLVRAADGSSSPQIC